MQSTNTVDSTLTLPSQPDVMLEIKAREIQDLSSMYGTSYAFAAIVETVDAQGSNRVLFRLLVVADEVGHSHLPKEMVINQILVMSQERAAKLESLSAAKVNATLAPNKLYVRRYKDRLITELREAIAARLVRTQHWD